MILLNKTWTVNTIQEVAGHSFDAPRELISEITITADSMPAFRKWFEAHATKDGLNKQYMPHFDREAKFWLATSLTPKSSCLIVQTVLRLPTEEYEDINLASFEPDTSEDFWISAAIIHSKRIKELLFLKGYRRDLDF